MPQRWVYYYYPFETSPPPFYRMAVQFVCPRKNAKSMSYFISDVNGGILILIKL
jgi:hypothetical protein